MINKTIDAELPVELEEQAVQFVRSAEAIFPFLVALTPGDRQCLTKLGKRSLDFVERSLMHAKENQDKLTPLVNLEQFDRDYRLMIQLRRILSIVESFGRKLRDTYMLTGSEAYEASRDFYDFVKRGAKRNIVGCEEIRKDLAFRYQNQGIKEDDPPGDIPASDQAA